MLADQSRCQRRRRDWTRDKAGSAVIATWKDPYNSWSTRSSRYGEPRRQREACPGDESPDQAPATCVPLNAVNGEYRPPPRRISSGPNPESVGYLDMDRDPVWTSDPRTSKI